MTETRAVIYRDPLVLTASVMARDNEVYDEAKICVSKCEGQEERKVHSNFETSCIHLISSIKITSLVTVKQIMERQKWYYYEFENTKKEN